MHDRADVKLAAIFRRGGQKEELLGDGPSSDKQELNQQLQQLAVAWAIPKSRRGLAAAVWRPQLGAFEVTARGRQQFNGQGFMHNKKLYLNIEEAVFMMDQAELMLLVEQQEGGQQQLLSMQEALHMMVLLGVSHDRLQLLSHLNRIGYHVRRHPACWLAPAEQPPAATWQCNPAWANTDGLPPPAAAASLRAAAAAQAGHAGLSVTVGQGTAADVGRQQQQQQQQTEQQRTKRRKVAGADADCVAQEQAALLEQQQPPRMHGWWDRAPAWLAGALEVKCSSTADGIEVIGAVHRQQAAAVGEEYPENELLGVQLRQRFSELRPLPTYTGQQQLQQQRTHKQPQEQHCAGADCSARWAAEMVYDVIPCQARFSYKCPPAPLISFAMPKADAACLPGLDELLQLSAAAAGGEPLCSSSSGRSTVQGSVLQEEAQPAAAAVEGGDDGDQQQQVSHGVMTELTGSAAAGVAQTAAGAAAAAAAGAAAEKSCRPVMVAMPDGGDVNFYELRPVRLMDLLANEY